MAFNKIRFLIIGGIIAALSLFPLTVKSDYLINLLILLFLNITITQSWNILGGFTGQISIGQSAFFGIGALATRLLWMADIPILLALLGGGLAAVVLAALIGLPSLRLRGVYFAIATLGLAIITRVVVGNAFPGVSFLPAKYLASFSLTPRYYLALALVLITIGVVYFLINSKLGMGMAAIKNDEEAASALGINTFKCKVYSLAISTFLAGLAGGVYAFYSAVYYYYVPFEISWSFDPLLMAVIGGAGTILGPILGAIGYVLLKEIFTVMIGKFNVLIFGILFIITVLSLPGGLIEAWGKLRRFHTSLILKREGKRSQ